MDQIKPVGEVKVCIAGAETQSSSESVGDAPAVEEMPSLGVLVCPSVDPFEEAEDGAVGRSPLRSIT